MRPPGSISGRQNIYRQKRTSRVNPFTTLIQGHKKGGSEKESRLSRNQRRGKQREMVGSITKGVSHTIRSFPNTYNSNAPPFNSGGREGGVKHMGGREKSNKTGRRYISP